MKKLITLVTICLLTGYLTAQQNYCDFEGTKLVYFGHYNGKLDSNAANPLIGPNNLSLKCGKYIRDTNQFDNLKIYPMGKLIDITPYASATGPKITMKVLSTAPAGSKIELQLGSTTYTTYPAGVHSQYTATTASSKTWELITFNHQISPSGSSVTATDINKLVVLYRPNKHERDTMYFDDLMGPDVVVGLTEQGANNTILFLQNVPNPANDQTNIQFVLRNDEQVLLNISDLLGHNLYTQNLNLTAGEHGITVNTTHFPEGIYFYTLKAGNISRSQKMVIAR